MEYRRKEEITKKAVEAAVTGTSKGKGKANQVTAVTEDDIEDLAEDWAAEDFGKAARMGVLGVIQSFNQSDE